MATQTNQDDYDPRIDEAKQFLKMANDADTMNRQEALEDLKFVNGDQWPVELQNSRNLESRPVLTINKLDGYCRQVVNQIRQQRPRPKVHGMNSQSDAKVAEVVQDGFGRSTGLEEDGFAAGVVAIRAEGQIAGGGDAREIGS